MKNQAKWLELKISWSGGEIKLVNKIWIWLDLFELFRNNKK